MCEDFYWENDYANNDYYIKMWNLQAISSGQQVQRAECGCGQMRMRTAIKALCDCGHEKTALWNYSLPLLLYCSLGIVGGASVIVAASVAVGGGSVVVGGASVLIVASVVVGGGSVVVGGALVVVMASVVVGGASVVVMGSVVSGKQ